MNSENLIHFIADLHNRLAEISVRGEDAIRMADILTKCRHVVSEAVKTADNDQTTT